MFASLQAQDLQTSFERLERDLYARTHERLDLNDVPCAVLRVSVSNAKDFTFSGNIIGDVIYHPGEAIIYMTNKSRKIHITSDKFGSLDVEFPERLEKQVVYKLTLKVIVPEAKKTRTLVMPLAGLGEVPSVGIMLGIVKKWGGYVKVKSNFSSQSTSLVCDKEGYIEGTNDQAWLTGKSASSRFALTAGVLYRVTLPFYLYAGGGFGSKKQAWEMPNDTWAEVSDGSTEGIEAELGGIYRFNNYAVSAGVQTNQFKYWEATLGVAFMF
jgi:hypothetical protein